MPNSDSPALTDSSQGAAESTGKPGASGKPSNERSALSVPFATLEKLVDTIDLLKDQPTLVALMIISLAVSVITLFAIFKDLTAGLYICIGALFILLVIVIAIALPYLREGARSAKTTADTRLRETGRVYGQKSPRPRPSSSPERSGRSRPRPNENPRDGGLP